MDFEDVSNIYGGGQYIEWNKKISGIQNSLIENKFKLWLAGVGDHQNLKNQQQ